MSNTAAVHAPMGAALPAPMIEAPVQAAPQAPQPPAAPRVRGPLSQAEVREIANDLAQGGREARQAAQQVAEAQRLADAQLAREQAAEAREQAAQAREQATQAREEAAQAAREAGGATPGTEAVVGVPAQGQYEIRDENGNVITFDPTQPPPAVAGTFGYSESPNVAIANTVKEVAGIIGGSLVAIVMSVLFFRTIGKWIDARKSPAALPREAVDRLARIENAIEAMAVEVERISEGQRFTTRLLSERSPVERGS
ncbi:MAG: hypothetical protein MUF21_10610 [Gemmatimonadaceae bacterium]|nr:hypothetical protein [Gemmatimonadaceae bacterium]